MQLIESKLGAGTIGYWTAWHPRYWEFLDTLTPVLAPHGSRLLRIQGDSSAGGCNKMVNHMFGDWLWFLPDDHTFKPDTLMHLLANKVDVCAPRVCRRHAPQFNTVAIKEINESNGMIRLWSWQEIAEAAKEKRLLPCQALGGSGLLVRKHVFEAIEKPYFSCALPDEISEDIDFTFRLYKAGVKLWLDPTQSITHLVDAALEWDFDKDGNFGLMTNIGGHRFKLQWDSEIQS